MCCQYEAVVMCKDQNAEQNHIINIGNSSFEMVEQFRYLCNNPNNTKLHSKRNEEQIKLTKSLLLFGVESLNLPALSKDIKIRICGIIILYVVLYGCETWSLTVREKRRLRRIFRPK